MERDGKMKDNIANKPLSLNVSTKIVAAVIVFVLVAVVFYFYVVAPKIEEIKGLNDQILKAEEKLNLLLLAQERLTSLEHEINLYNDRLVELKNILPETKDEFLFSLQFVSLAKASGGSIVSLTFQGDTQGATQNVAVFDLKYEGAKYENVTKFLNMLKNNYPEIISFLRVDILKTIEAGQTSAAKYIVSINGSINLSQRK